MINDKEFLAFQDGIFKPYFEKYIALKRGKGEKVSRSTLIRLKLLNNSLCRIKSNLDIDRETVEYLLLEKSAEQDASRAIRVSDLRHFNAFLKTLGFNAYQIPNQYMHKVHVAFKPHIFSPEELLKITEIADHLRASKRSSNYYKVYPIIIRILIGAGLRISELLGLKIKDIDIANRLLIVINSKNHVSRYVPVSASLWEIIAKYVSKLPHKDNPEQYLFISPYTGTRYSYDAMRYTFKKIFAESGIRTAKGRLPRIHDVRHSFCTISLNRMLSSGLDLQVAVPILSAYMGHVNLKDTEKYIHLTEHGYDEFIHNERALKALIPEVDEDER